jgi:hypothetical protein
LTGSGTVLSAAGLVAIGLLCLPQLAAVLSMRISPALLRGFLWACDSAVRGYMAPGASCPAGGFVCSHPMVAVRRSTETHRERPGCRLK